MNRKTWLIIGYILVFVAALFLMYAILHPEMAFSWPKSVTNAFYIGYIVATIFSFVMACVLPGNKNEETEE
jgi:uncharacterized membrane protein